MKRRCLTCHTEKDLPNIKLLEENGHLWLQYWRCGHYSLLQNENSTLFHIGSFNLNSTGSYNSSLSRLWAGRWGLMRRHCCLQLPGWRTWRRLSQALLRGVWWWGKRQWVQATSWSCTISGCWDQLLWGTCSFVFSDWDFFCLKELKELVQGEPAIYSCLSVCQRGAMDTWCPWLHLDG